jgi:hypothetical protein
MSVLGETTPTVTTVSGATTSTDSVSDTTLVASTLDTTTSGTSATPTSSMPSAMPPASGNQALIIGAAVGGAILALLVVLGAVALVCRRRRRRADDASDESTGSAIALTHVDRPGYATTAADFRASSQQSQSIYQDVSYDKAPSVTSTSNDVLPMPSTTSTSDGGATGRVSWVIASSEVTRGRVLGQGQFGVVCRGEWRGISVAIKQIKKAAIGGDSAVAEFEAEIGRMSGMPPHKNIVLFYGVVRLADDEIGAVLEFCEQGALVDMLYGDKRRDLSEQQQLQIAYDAACGVMHLHANRIVHRDLAARNVLLSGVADLVAKVSDFGMARDVESAYSVQETMNRVGPIRWMSPEQLERLAYSQASDVFAFGVLLFEIFAREQPWLGFANVNVMAKVARGERMQPPDGVPPAIAQLMREAWAHDAAARPKMSAVRERLLAAKTG